MWNLLSSLFAASASPYGMECTITLPRHPLPGPGFAAHIVPVPDDSGITLTWQDGETIVLQHFGRDCYSSSPVFEVNKTRDFWRQPATSGLQDAAGLRGGATVIVWTLADSVWTRIMQADGSGGPIVRASGPAVSDRAQVRVSSNPIDGGFVVVWSSWGQDGDGWGIFARQFLPNGQPLGEEKQVNSEWRHFQWQPLLTWCDDSLWALWQNGTGGSCSRGSGDCMTGPLLRRLTAAGNWDPGIEVSLHGDGPMAATLACSGGRGGHNAVVAVLWLQHRGREVRWEYIQSQAGMQLPAPLFSRRRLEPQQPFLGKALDSHKYLETSNIEQSLVADTATSISSEILAESAAAAKDTVDFGQVVMLAHAGLMMLLTNDRSGSLGAQLMSYGASPRPVAFPRRQIASGVRLARVAWDTTSDLALVSCWTAGGAFKADDPSVFVCVRHGVWWFVGSYITPNIGSVLALSTVLSLLYVCCCLGRCSQLLCVSWPLPIINRGRRIVVPARRTTARQTRLRRLREVREQLAQIPGTVARSQPQPGCSDGEEGGADAEDGGPLCMSVTETAEPGDSDTDERAGALQVPTRDVCSICQEEVAVWVALRPCGHTACRDCTLRLAERSQKCHICRGAIKGVQPVYI